MVSDSTKVRLCPVPGYGVKQRPVRRCPSRWSRGSRCFRRRFSGLGSDRHRGIGLEDPEAEALFEVEPRHVGVVVEISDGQILAGVEDEVAAAQAEHHPAVDAWCPHQWATEDSV